MDWKTNKSNFDSFLREVPEVKGCQGHDRFGTTYFLLEDEIYA